MNKSTIILHFIVSFTILIMQTYATSNLQADNLFNDIYNVSDTILTRLETQTANKQHYLLSVTLGFTLFECILLITSLILHVASITVLKNSRIIAH